MWHFCLNCEMNFFQEEYLFTSALVSMRNIQTLEYNSSNM